MRIINLTNQDLQEIRTAIALTGTFKSLIELLENSNEYPINFIIDAEENIISDEKSLIDFREQYNFYL